MTKVCRRCVVSGKVQGVFYRQGTKEQALSLNLTGWVKNLDDGTVELIICGQMDDINTMLDWLPKGPPRAKVDDVTIEQTAMEDFKTFEILR